jgi:hypothetical protein
MAACLALMTFAGYQAQRLGWFQAADKDPGPVAKKDAPARDKKPGPKNDSIHPEQPAPPSLSQTFGEAGTLAFALTRRTAVETMSKARQWLPPAKPLPVPLSGLKPGETLAPVLGAPAKSLRQAGHNVSAGLQPVATSARRAIHLFMHDMPALDSGKKSGS